MSPARKAAALGAGLAALAWAVWWAAGTWRVVHPRPPLQAVETRTLRVSYPSDWEPVDPTDPRLGDKELVFSNRPRPDGPAWERLRLRMALRDEGTAFASLGDFTAWLRRDEGGRAPEEDWLLANGVRARTWVESEALGDIPARMRWVAFQGRDGRYYSAGFLLPSDWRARLRCVHLFGAVLGSLEFKVPGAGG